MNRSVYETQIQNLRNKRLGKAKPAKKVLGKNPSGSIKLSSSTTFHTQTVPALNNPSKTVSLQNNGGCGCSRRK